MAGSVQRDELTAGFVVPQECEDSHGFKPMIYAALSHIVLCFYFRTFGSATETYITTKARILPQCCVQGGCLPVKQFFAVCLNSVGFCNPIQYVCVCHAWCCNFRVSRSSVQQDVSSTLQLPGAACKLQLHWQLFSVHAPVCVRCVYMCVCVQYHMFNFR
jgi:hypothetical protein